MVVYCVHPVAVLNAVFCITCSLLMLIEDERGDHMEEAYSRAGRITAMSVSFCLTHPVTVSVVIIVMACVLVLRYSECVGYICEFWV